MAFDQPTRRQLESLVSDARRLLVNEFQVQLRTRCGLDPQSGAVIPLERLTDLSDTDRETARLLQETVAHYQATTPQGTAADAIDRVLREQAFTVLNRLAALRMAEARGLIVEAIGGGYESKGFRVFSQLAGPALGGVAERYRCFIFSLFDELAIDLPVLFDRWTPQGRLFPGQTCMEKLFALLNAPGVQGLWAEDETIGWVYQYFNSKEERKKMRDESPTAPRNSRELAVRNQFFTPRYVVEFLTDNTLGRTWYEMRKGKTRLAETCRYLVRQANEIFLAGGEAAPEQPEPPADLSQEELLKLPVFIPHRPVKDPREIRMLDPACGSMHFGLYAFDLFLVIYEEAWDIEDLPTAEGFKPLREAYASREEFLRDVPRLILEHNIHGIDIDPRAVQIAGLSLWLRAQRAWQEQGIKTEHRPRITRSNVACAEPMPGDANLLEEFIDSELGASPEGRLLAQLVRRVFEAMELAGEAGTLLKIEEEIAGAVVEAKKQWASRPRAEQGEFLERETLHKERVDFDVSGITTARFWKTAEKRIYDALEAYAEQAGESGGYRRRLFAEDAARGFAFVDLCRRQYDVVLMNPPFGMPPQRAAVQQALKSGYPNYKKNLACAFFYAAQQRALKGGFIGVICDRSLFFRKTYKQLRLAILKSEGLVFTDLGWEVMDEANVEAAALACSLLTAREGARMQCFDVRHSGSRAESLLQMITDGSDRTTPLSGLRNFPNAAFAHWVVPSLVDVFARSDPACPQLFQASNGMSACDSPRFIRLWWEVPPGEGYWFPLAHGGGFSAFCRPYYFVVNWGHNGSEVKAYIVDRYPYLNGDPGWVLKNEALFFRAGLSYGKRTGVLSAQAMPAQFIFSDEGQAVFPSVMEDTLFVLAYLNSRLVRYLINCYCGQHKHSGYLNVLPAFHIPSSLADVMRDNASVGMHLHLKWEALRDHGSRYFVTSTQLPENHISLKQSIRHELLARLDEDKRFLSAWLDIQERLESLAGLAQRDSARFLVACGGDPHSNSFPEGAIDEKGETEDGGEDAGVPDDGEEGSDESTSDVYLTASHYGYAVEIAASLGVPLRSLENAVEAGRADALVSCRISQMLDECVGQALGRWDVRYALGARPLLELPDPFDPVPVCPPGILQNDAGLPLTPDDVRELNAVGRWDYPIDIPWDGILVDDPGHPFDIEARVGQIIKIIWKSRAEVIEHEACTLLGVASLRDYFRKPAAFFADHLKRYSKSRRQAPIYWPLSTASGSYTLWIYYHRLTDQTLFTCINDFIEPKLTQVADRVGKLRGNERRGKSENRELEELLDLEAELKDMRDELLRLTRLPWKPNLNDGVQITAAPLWKLFIHKPWQKKLKETWEALEKGEYDWAHLAYTIRPNEVREKCRKDRSLAIAHDLEGLYVEAPTAPKKRGRKASGGVTS